MCLDAVFLYINVNFQSYIWMIQNRVFEDQENRCFMALYNCILLLYWMTNVLQFNNQRNVNNLKKSERSGL